MGKPTNSNETPVIAETESAGIPADSGAVDGKTKPTKQAKPLELINPRRVKLAAPGEVVIGKYTITDNWSVIDLAALTPDEVWQLSVNISVVVKGV